MVMDIKENEGTKAGDFIQHGTEEMTSRWVSLEHQGVRLPSHFLLASRLRPCSWKSIFVSPIFTYFPVAS